MMIQTNSNFSPMKSNLMQRPLQCQDLNEMFKSAEANLFFKTQTIKQLKTLNQLIMVFSLMMDSLMMSHMKIKYSRMKFQSSNLRKRLLKKLKQELHQRSIFLTREVAIHNSDPNTKHYSLTTISNHTY